MSRVGLEVAVAVTVLQLGDKVALVPASAELVIERLETVLGWLIVISQSRGGRCCLCTRARALRRARRHATYEHVAALDDSGLLNLAISRCTGVSRHRIILCTVRRACPMRHFRAPYPRTAT
jgi:hypothetical protein